MTAAELRDLLEQVEAHGGPAEVVGLLYGREIIGHTICSWDELDEPTSQDVVVGVLKRDLIERGIRGSEHWYPHDSNGRHSPVWVHRVDLWNERLERCADTSYCNSELEAILKAWLAAAEAESWK